MKPFVAVVLLATVHPAFADKDGSAMYVIHYHGGTIQKVGDDDKPVGTPAKITGKPSGMQACRLTNPPKGITETWFQSHVDEQGKITMTHAYGTPKDVASCAIGVIANLPGPLGSGPGEYKFAAKVSFTRSK